MKITNLKLAFLLFGLIFSAVCANALTASIGNARMILEYKLEDGKENVIEKTILVKNVNNVTVLVNLKPDSVLEGITEIPVNNITLAPETEKDFLFRVKPTGPGEINGKINVFFSDPEGKQSGVVLTSTVIIYVLDEDGTMPNEEKENETTINPEVELPETVDNEEENKTPVSVSVGGTGNVVGSDAAKNGNGPNWFFIAFIGLLSAIFLVIIIIIMRRS